MLNLPFYLRARSAQRENPPAHIYALAYALRPISAAYRLFSAAISAGNTPAEFSLHALT